MPWPTVIELHNRQAAASNNGAIIQNVWAVKPYDAAEAVQVALLGRIDGGARILPAKDFRWSTSNSAKAPCYCTEATIVPFDPKQFSYAGSTKYDPGHGSLPSITQALEGTLDLAEDANYTITSNRDYSNTAFISATYRPMLSYYAGGQEARRFDYLVDTVETRQKQNVINAGLRIMVAPIPGLPVAYYPGVGTAPTFNEEYIHLVIQRKMVRTLDTDSLNKIVNKIAFGNWQPADTRLPTYPLGTCRFDGYEPELVIVPTVNGNGDPDGFSSWYDIRLHFSIRTLKAKNVGDANGTLRDDVPVTWNHVLCYPGNLYNLIQLGGATLAWWQVRYAFGVAGANDGALPYLPELIADFEKLFTCGM